MSGVRRFRVVFGVLEFSDLGFGLRVQSSAGMEVKGDGNRRALSVRALRAWDFAYIDKPETPRRKFNKKETM